MRSSLVLDVVVNKPFKGNLRKEYGNWLLSGQQLLTPSGKIKNPLVSLLEIDLGLIAKGFKKCCISDDLNGTADDILSETESLNENTDDTDVTTMSSHSENGSDSE